MKFKIFIFGLFFLAGLLLSVPVFAMITYSRTPTGYNTYNPVDFTITADTLEDLFPEGALSVFSWQIFVKNNVEDKLGNCRLSSELGGGGLLEFDIPTNVEYVEVYGYPFLACVGDIIEGVILEGEKGGSIAFVVGEEPVAPEESPSTTPIITLPTNMATSMLAYAGQLFTDLSTLLLVLIGLPLGFWVVRKVLSLVKAK
jgi:hypothetical protein